MVMPRSRSSGALSIESNERNLMFGLCFDSTLVIAAVKVVLPWSMCPIVPTFTCGLLRSNFSLAMSVPFSVPVFGLCYARFAGGTGETPVPTQSKSLPCWATLILGNDLFRYVARRFFVTREVHRVLGAALGRRAHVRRVSEHFGERHDGLDDLRAGAVL